jgi:hypothetical protein
MAPASRSTKEQSKIAFETGGIAEMPRFASVYLPLGSICDNQKSLPDHWAARNQTIPMVDAVGPKRAPWWRTIMPTAAEAAQIPIAIQLRMLTVRSRFSVA